MMPFEYRDPEMFGPDWDMMDMVAECVAKLSETDQKHLHQIFYDRNTYEAAAQNLGVPAKSQVWRKTKIALERLKAELLKHPEFQKLIGETNERTEQS